MKHNTKPKPSVPKAESGMGRNQLSDSAIVAIVLVMIGAFELGVMFQWLSDQGIELIAKIASPVVIAISAFIASRAYQSSVQRHRIEDDRHLQELSNAAHASALALIQPLNSVIETLEAAEEAFLADDKERRHVSEISQEDYSWPESFSVEMDKLAVDASRCDLDQLTDRAAIFAKDLPAEARAAVMYFSNVCQDLRRDILHREPVFYDKIQHFHGLYKSLLMHTIACGNIARNKISPLCVTPIGTQS